MEYRRYWFC